jgi:hypothetical protein
LKDNGCYAEQGNLSIIWAALSRAKPGHDVYRGVNHTPRSVVHTLTWNAFTSEISSLPEWQLWRHNQAGDLPGEGDTIDIVALAQLVNANRGKRGFTYTHKPTTKNNAGAIRYANANGFTVNLSANNLGDADRLAELGIGPVVVVLPDTVQGNTSVTTPAGRKVAVCPATYRDDVSCASCQLCQRQERKVIIGFPAHGTAKRKASNVARGE